MSLERWGDAPERPLPNHPVQVVEVIKKDDGSLIVVVVLSTELSERSRALCQEFGISEDQLIERLTTDLFRGSVRREYVSVVQQESNLRRLLAARAMGQASTEELGELVRQLDRLKEISVELVRDLVLERDLAVQMLLEEDARYEWPALPRPAAVPRSGRPRTGEGNDLSWLKMVIDITRIHDREHVSYAQAAARKGISEKQFHKYRQTGRDMGLLSDDD